MKKFALCLLALCAALVPIGGLAVPGWATECTISDVTDITSGNKGFFTLNNGYYTLNDAYDVLTFNTDITGLTKGLRINKPYTNASTLTINGNGHTLSCNIADTTGENKGSVIIIAAGNITINDLTITGGNTNGKGGGIYSSAWTLTVTNCRFNGNKAIDGGGIYHSGPAIIDRCTFTGNTASNSGGVYVSNSGNQPATITNCTFAEDSAYLAGNVNADYCTFVGDIQVEANATVTNSIIYCDGFEPDETNLTLASAPTAASKEVTAGTGTITHTFYRVNEAVGRGTSDNAPDLDQLGVTRAEAAPTIGAVAFDGKLDFTVTAKQGLTGSGTSFSGYVGQDVTLSPDVTPAGLAFGCKWAWSYKSPSTALPPGLKIDANTGVITGTPNAVIDKETAYHFTVTATNTNGKSYTASKELTVTLQPITIGTSAATTFNATAGTSLDNDKTVTFTVTPGNTADYSWTVTGSAPGVTASMSGATLTLTGTPSTKGDYTFKVKATKTVGGFALSSNAVPITLTVSGTTTTLNPNPVDGTSFTVNAGESLGTAGKSVTFTPALTGQTYSWSVNNGTTDTTTAPGVTASIANGKLTLTGTPTKAGNYTYTVTAKTKNDGGATASGTANVSLTVNPVTAQIKPDNETVNGTPGVEFERTIDFTATPSNLTYTWNVSPASANGVTASIANGKLTLTGKPEKEGKNVFTVTAQTDDDGKTAYGTATVTLDTGAAVLTKLNVAITDGNNHTLTVKHGGSDTLTLAATVTATYSDGNTNPLDSGYTLEWTSKNTPSGITFADGVVTAGNTLDVDSYPFTVSVKAKSGSVESQAATASVTVTVTEATLTGITVTFTQAPEKLEVTQGETGKAVFAATATATYSDEKETHPTPSYELVGNSNKWVTLSGSTVKAEPSTAVAPGDYKVTVTATASEGGQTKTADKTLTVTVKEKPTATVSSVSVTLPPASSALTVEQGKTATTSFTATATATYSDNSTKALTPTLSLTSSYRWITLSGSTVTAKPSTAVAPGDYKVTVTATAAEGGKTDTATATLTVTVTKSVPAKTDPTVTKNPVGNNLTYTGAAQALVTAGGATGGKMMYSLNKDSGYTENIPTGTEAKTYTVWWYVKGDETHNDTAKGSVTATINSKPDEHTTADITGVKLNITTDTPTIKLKPGETATLKFTATTTVTYKDGSKKSEPAQIYLWWMYDNLDWPEWLSITKRGDGEATVTASPTAGVGGGTRTVHIAAKTQSACYNGNYDWTRCEFKVNVDVPETFTPGTLTFDKAHVEMTAAPGDTVEESVNVDFKLRGSGGTIKDDTEGEYAIKCQKIDGPDWVTASVAGQKVTFRATAPKTGGTSSTSIFNVYVQDKDGKQYLKTSYRVVANVAKLKSYQITVAPAEITCLDTNLNEVAMDLNPYVRLEKLYDNGTRKAVDDFKLEFTPPEKDGTIPNWFDFRENGWVRIDPRFSKEVGEYFYTYKVTARAPDGQTKTGTGAITVNIVSEGAPVITTETLPDAEAYAAYTTNLDATGMKSITWELTDGKLPTGMSLNKETGKISGTAKIEPKDFTFTVKATNSAGSRSRELTIKVVDQKIKVGDQKVPWKISYTTSVKKTSSSSKGTWKVKFNVKNGTNVKYEDASDKGNLDKNHLKEVVVTKGGKPGDGLIQYTLYWPYDKNTKRGDAYTYNFKVQASNTTGKSTLTKSYIVDEDGNVDKPDDTASVAVASGPAAILTGDGDDGEETFEPYKDGSAPKNEAFSEGKTYFTNGSMDPKTGDLYVVIGTPVEGDDEGKEYVFDKVGDIPVTSRDKVVSVGFRSGSNFDANTIRSLPNLSELTIDEGDVTKLDLSDMKKLETLSLYGCVALTSLNVSRCNNLASLSVMECPALSTLNVTGCGALEDVEVTDAAITALDLSNRSKLTTLSANGCGLLETLNLAGSYALTDVSLDSTDITALDLSACAGLKSLSLADVTKLETLTLPTDVKFDSFTLTESRVGGSLTVNGTEQLTTLNLSGNAGLTGLDLSGCPELKMLDVSGCEFEILDLSQCTALEKLNASECAWMTTLTLPNGGTQDASVSAQGSAVSATAGKLKELSVGGCVELRSLNVSGMSLGHLELDGLKWLTSVQSDGQFIGNVDLSQSMNLKDYAGNCLYRVSDVQGYAADGSPVKTEFNKDTGVVTFASQPYDMSYVYDTGLYGYVLGVTVSPASEPDMDSPTSNRGGGCDALSGGLLALGALGLVAARKK